MPTLCVNKEKKESLINFILGFSIYINGIKNWRIWLYMSVAEIRRRYRRTLIGPFWFTLSLALFIGSIGMIFPILWHTDMKSFLPFFASGYIIWTFIATVIIESCGAFVDASSLIKQTTLPYSVYAYNVVTRNVIVLFHHLTVYIAIILWFNLRPNANTLLFIPGLLILCVTSSWVGILFGLLTSRFRDIRQLIANLLQIGMFVTPIFWSSNQLGQGKIQFLININPLYHFIQIVRAPLLGMQPHINNWIISLLICFIGWVVTLRLLGKYSKHLVFWL